MLKMTNALTSKNNIGTFYAYFLILKYYEPQSVQGVFFFLKSIFQLYRGTVGRNPILAGQNLVIIIIDFNTHIFVVTDVN